ncbi:aminopeptidase P family protein (plasmid) [Staphylococcus epidermidis]|nr:M24 family metallopeptidase [Staphylococcus epidermidis]UTP75846.1 aminopeptidase P family protein [Staphylococcus epidermidis]
MIKIGRQSVGGQRQPNNSVEFPEESFIWFDCDISYKGYWSDVARIIISKHSQYKYQKEYNILHQAQREAIQKLRPGMKASEAYNLVMNYAIQNGMKHYKRNHVGHGIGLEPYEMPVLSRDNDQVIEENMVLCIETPYYEYGLGALHVEDLVLIKEEGNIVLNQTSGDLIEWEDE